jgi:hypothetical protein
MTEESRYIDELEDTEGIHKHNCEACQYGDQCKELNERYKNTEEREEFYIDMEKGCSYFDSLYSDDTYYTGYFSEDNIMDRDIDKGRVSYREDFYQYTKDFN